MIPCGIFHIRLEQPLNYILDLLKDALSTLELTVSQRKKTSICHTTHHSKMTKNDEVRSGLCRWLSSRTTRPQENAYNGCSF